MSTNYKLKYLDMRSKLLEATDVAYRLGYEKGMKDSKQQQAEMQQQQQIQMQQAAMAGANGQSGKPDEKSGAASPQSLGDPMDSPQDDGGMPMENASNMQNAMMGGDPQNMSQQQPSPEDMGEDGSELDGHISELENLVAKGEKPTVLSLRQAVEKLAGVRKSQKNKWKSKTDKNSSAQKEFVSGIIKKWEGEIKETAVDLEKILEQHNIKTGK